MSGGQTQTRHPSQNPPWMAEGVLPQNRCATLRDMPQ